MIPVISTVAIAVLLLLQAPPVPLVSGIVAPAQTVLAPVIGAGCGFTVTVLMVKQPVARI
jgi:hypothetical protein